MVTYIPSFRTRITNPIIKESADDVMDDQDLNLMRDDIGYIAEIAFADSPYTPPTNVQLVKADATGGAITINLTDATTIAAKIITFKKTDASANTVTLDPSGSQTIDLSATLALSTQHETVSIESDSANWQRLLIPGAGAGDVTGAANVGGATGQIFRDEAAGVINLKTLEGGTNVTISNGADKITISVAALVAALNDLTDVTISGAATGEYLRKSAGDWVNSTIQAGDLPSHNHAASDINSGTMATARLGSGSATASTFLRGDQTWASPSTVSTGFTVPSAATVAAINTAMGTTARNKVGLSSATTYTLGTNNTPILFPRADGQELDGQRAKVQVTATDWSTTDSHISCDTGAFNYARLNHIEFDFNDSASPNTHTRGISNYTSSNQTTGNTNEYKHWIIEDIVFTGHGNAGKEPIYLAQLENGSIIKDVRINALAGNSSNRTAGIRLVGSNTGSVEGNIIVRDCYITTTNYAKGILIENNLERILMQGVRVFYFGSTSDNNCIGFHLNPSSNDRFSNRAWWIDNCSAEDCMTAVHIDIQTPGAGADGIAAFQISNFLADMKELSTTTGNSIGINITGTGNAAGHIHNSDIRPRFNLTGEQCIGINIDSAVLTDSSRTGITIHDVTFIGKYENSTSTADTTFIPIKGLESQDEVYISNCRGYNPLGAITTPWKGSELNNPDSWAHGTTPTISGGSATPTNGTTYTCRHTKKTVIIAGGVVTGILINGVTTGLTSGPFDLDPGMTIRVNFTTVPTTASVYCH